MFLRLHTSDDHTMQEAYSGLQKSLRANCQSSAVYWAGQVARPGGKCKGYPNALRKRLCQNALEDACNWFIFLLCVESIAFS
jgi:replication-associated recombination protein RarA